MRIISLFILCLVGLTGAGMGAMIFVQSGMHNRTTIPWDGVAFMAVAVVSAVVFAVHIGSGNGRRR